MRHHVGAGAGAKRFAVVGQLADENSSFVRHVGLLNRDVSDLRDSFGVPASHMVPPIEASGEIRADLIGELNDLSVGEVNRMGLWLEEKVGDCSPRGLRAYIAVPHFCDGVKDEVTGVPRGSRFSCIGFVIECYRYGTRSDLISTEESDLPQVPRPEIDFIYGEYAEPLRKYIGIGGGGPFPIVLPGYFFHALNRDDKACRKDKYKPQRPDSHFPHPASK